MSWRGCFCFSSKKNNSVQFFCCMNINNQYQAPLSLDGRFNYMRGCLYVRTLIFQNDCLFISTPSHANQSFSFLHQIFLTEVAGRGSASLLLTARNKRGGRQSSVAAVCAGRAVTPHWPRLPKSSGPWRSRSISSALSVVIKTAVFLKRGYKKILLWWFSSKRCSCVQVQVVVMVWLRRNFPLGDRAGSAKIFIFLCCRYS